MKEYVEEAIEVGKEELFGEAYDHEKANMEQSYLYGLEDGVEKGIKQGIQEGIQQQTKEMVKSLYENGITDKELLAKSANISLEEIENILKQ